MALSRRVYVNYELRQTWKREAMTPFLHVLISLNRQNKAGTFRKDSQTTYIPKKKKQKR